MVEESMKNAIKLTVRTTLPKLKLSIEPETLSIDNIAQIILVCDRIFWTEMSELYMTTSTYNEYKLLLRKEEENITSYLQVAPKQKWLQTALRLSQMMHFR